MYSDQDVSAQLPQAQCGCEFSQTASVIHWWLRIIACKGGNSNWFFRCYFDVFLSEWRLHWLIKWWKGRYFHHHYDKNEGQLCLQIVDGTVVLKWDIVIGAEHEWNSYSTCISILSRVLSVWHRGSMELLAYNQTKFASVIQNINQELHDKGESEFSA